MTAYRPHELLSIVTHLLLYPVTLSPLVLWIFFREERRRNPGLGSVILLLIYSSLVAASSSLQLFFSHIDLLLELGERTRDLLFQILSALFLAGTCLFLSRLPVAVRQLAGRDTKPRRTERAIDWTAYAVSGLTAILLLFAIWPPFMGLERLLAVMLALSFAAFLVSIARSLVCLFREAPGSPQFIPFVAFLSGDLLLLAFRTLLPNLYGPLLISVLFIYHFFCLFVILKRIWPERMTGSLTEEEKTARFLSAGLSKRESEIALALVKGYSYRKIADIHCISLSTVQTHVSRIYGKLEVRNKTSLAAFLENR